MLPSGVARKASRSGLAGLESQTNWREQRAERKDNEMRLRLRIRTALARPSQLWRLVSGCHCGLRALALALVVGLRVDAGEALFTVSRCEHHDAALASACRHGDGRSLNSHVSATPSSSASRVSFQLDYGTRTVMALTERHPLLRLHISHAGLVRCSAGCRTNRRSPKREEYRPDWVFLSGRPPQNSLILSGNRLLLYVSHPHQDHIVSGNTQGAIQINTGCEGDSSCSSL